MLPNAPPDVTNALRRIFTTDEEDEPRWDGYFMEPILQALENPFLSSSSVVCIP